MRGFLYQNYCFAVIKYFLLKNVFLTKKLLFQTPCIRRQHCTNQPRHQNKYIISIRFINIRRCRYQSYSRSETCEQWYCHRQPSQRLRGHHEIGSGRTFIFPCNEKADHQTRPKEYREYDPVIPLKCHCWWDFLFVCNTSAMRWMAKICKGNCMTCSCCFIVSHQVGREWAVFTSTSAN